MGVERMARRTPCRIIYGACAILSAAAANASELPSPGLRTAPVYASGSFDLSVSAGVMSARATETVHASRNDGSGLPPGARISNLVWTTEVSGLLGLTFGWNASSHTRLEASFYAPVLNDANRMTNMDWLNPDVFPDWTDRSLHSDTRGGGSHIADLRLAHQFYRAGDFTASALAGFRRTQMSWKAYGGSFLYTEASAEDCSAYGSTAPAFDPGSTFRNCAGVFDPVAQIAYRQVFDTPFLGARGSYTSGPWRVSADVVAAPYAWASDRDLHVAQTLFKSTFRGMKMFGATMQGSYRLSAIFSGFIEAEGQWHLHRKGELEAWDVATGEYVNYGPSSAGASLRMLRVSAGLKAGF